MRPVVSFLDSLKYIRSYIFSCGRSHCGCWSYQQKSCNEKEFAEGISHAELNCAYPDVVWWACKFEVWEAFVYALLGGSKQQQQGTAGSACLLCCCSDFGEETSSDFISYVLFGTVLPSNQPYVRLWLQLSRWVCFHDVLCFQCGNRWSSERTAAKSKFELQDASRYRSKIIAHWSPYSCLLSL